MRQGYLDLQVDEKLLIEVMHETKHDYDEQQVTIFITLQLNIIRRIRSHQITMCRTSNNNKGKEQLYNIAGYSKS